VNKPNSQANATSCETSDASNLSGSTGVSQEKIDQLVSLLQPANLFPSGSTPPSGPATNHISVSLQISSSYTTSSSSSAGIFNINTYSPPSTSFWLIDLGANEHICSTLSHLSSFYQIKPVYVTLPNCSSVIVNHAGNIPFSSQFHLTNVLYSPSFKLNFISVAKFCQSLSSNVQFSFDKCIIQDQISMKMIGLANKMDDLYKFHVPSLASVNSISSQINKPCNCSSSISCNSSTYISIKAL